MRSYSTMIFKSEKVKKSKQDEELRKEKELLTDITYIRNDIVAKQPNGNYCRYSKILKSANNYNLKKEEYIRYWKNKYSRDKQRLEQIIEEITLKLDTGLISTEQMIKLIQEGKDTPKEKLKILKYLKDKNAEQTPNYKEIGSIAGKIGHELKEDEEYDEDNEEDEYNEGDE